MLHAIAALLNSVVRMTLKLTFKEPIKQIRTENPANSLAVRKDSSACVFYGSIS